MIHLEICLLEFLLRSSPLDILSIAHQWQNDRVKALRKTSESLASFSKKDTPRQNPITREEEKKTGSMGDLNWGGLESSYNLTGRPGA